MITIPFNLFDLNNTSYKEHQNFAQKLDENISKSLIKDKSNENLAYKSLKQINGDEIRTSVLNWFSKISQEEKITICTIRSKWLIEAFYQMYLLFQRNNKISFDPSEEMFIFIKKNNEDGKANQNSLNSFNLLNLIEVSSNDESKFSKNKVKRETNSKEGYSIDIDSPFIYFKESKNENNEKCLDKIKLEEEFLKHIKIISLNEDELDTLTISLELLSNVELFKKYFKFFTNDNYFRDWIFPFENKKEIKNFYLPFWMTKCNLSFCQIIIGFLEQQILLNYEYFYYNNKIYEISNNDKVINLHKKIDDFQDELINKFKNIYNKNEIKKEKNNIKKNENYNNNKTNSIYQINKIEKNDIIINKNNNNSNLIYNDNQNKEDYNEKLERIISNTSMSTLNDSISQYEEEEEDSLFINSDINNSSVNINIKFSEKFSNKDNIIYNLNDYYNDADYYNFINMVFTYYDQGIFQYWTIVNNNLMIFNKFKEKYQNEIQCFIKDNLKDKYDIDFGHYGSYNTGLQIEGSDMDIFILYKSKGDNNNILTFRDELYDLFKKNKSKYGPFKLPDDVIPPLVILNIDINDEIRKIPINNDFNYINYQETEKLKVDLTFNNNEEFLHIYEKNVIYVKNAINEYPQIKPVILILKRYFKNINMNKVFRGGISSFSIFLLTLNAIKSYLKDNGNRKIGISQLLFYVLKKFSTFDFSHYGIGSDNYDYKLIVENSDESLYILDPITGKNIADGPCKGDKLRKAFTHAYNILTKEFNYFLYLGYLPRYRIPISSINSLFHSRINFFE